MPHEFSYKSLCQVQGSDTVQAGLGRNVIPEPASTPAWKLFLAKFKDPLIVILLVVWCLSVGISVYEMLVMGRSASCLIEPAGILIAILLATGIGFLLEMNAEKEFKILNKKKDERLVRVYRWRSQDDCAGGKKRPFLYQIKKCDVVAGDVVKLESGDEIPADGRLIRSLQLRVDESVFTGEPYASKYAEGDSSGESTYPVDFLLRGTTVLEGDGLYQVTAVGLETEEGKGAETLSKEQPVETPLNRQLGQFARWISVASYIIAALIVVGRLAYYFFFDGNDANDGDVLEIAEFCLQSIMIAVTLIVVAVPEGLPMSVTISLALSMKKMLRQNNLVRKLHACETMGAATVICTDKTGTLTQNKMQVKSFAFYSPDRELIVQSFCVNSTAELTVGESEDDLKPVGNPTEGAVLLWLSRFEGASRDYGYYREHFTVLDQKPFNSQAKYMETLAVDDGNGCRYRFVKGAPEIVLSMCDAVADGTGREAVEAYWTQAQEKGMRTLGLAIQRWNGEEVGPLHYVATLAIQDPVRDDVRSAIRTCRRAGVRVVMVTGDVARTAIQIGLESGILESDVEPVCLTGQQFAEMPHDEALATVSRLQILSRARPEDKLRLVSLLQESGEVVAVTGDGTNDALALKKAHVGLSMGDGTARAKEASDITIIDNSFSSINNAILWGRSLYMNIKRFILFQLTINVCACLIVLLGAFLGLDSPLTVTQMLWVNLIMDTFAAIALSTLPPDRLVMREKPRNPESHIVDRRMVWRIGIVGGIFFIFLAGLWQMLWHTDVTPEAGVSGMLSWDNAKIFVTELFNFSKNKPHLSPYESGVFFTTFVMLQVWNLFNSRYFATDRSLLGDLKNRIAGGAARQPLFSEGFVGILFVILLGQFFIVNVAGDLFDVAALGWRDWLYIVLITGVIVMILPDLFRSLINLFLKKEKA